MRTITQKDIGEILQHVYDSEINIRIGWLWDGGVDYSVGTTSSDIWDSQLNTVKIHYTCLDRIASAIGEICTDLIITYPESDFAKWFIRKFS